jgi:hypothetical protein
MNVSRLLPLVFFFCVLHPGFCNETTVHEAAHDIMPDPVSKLKVIPRNLEIKKTNALQAGHYDLTFDIIVENASPFYKQDVTLPLSVILTDEFGNRYADRRLTSPTVSFTDSSKQISLYPGEKLYFPFRFQAPVPAAQQIEFRVCDQTGICFGDAVYPAAEIRSHHLIVETLKISDEDMAIVYPVEKRVFVPGDTVFLKIDFSENAGRPDTVYVVLPDYMFTDPDAGGKYEIQIPSQQDEGDFEIIVMGEWGTPPRAQMASKSLHLVIKK